MEPRTITGLLLCLGLWHGAAGAASSHRTKANVSTVKVHSKEECCHACTRDPDCTLAVHAGPTCWLWNNVSRDGDKDEKPQEGEVACRPKAHNDTQGADESFNCNAGQVQTWSSGKAQWCCAKRDIGCPFSCALLGYPEQKVAWSAEKKAWCCTHHKASCEEQEEVHRAADLRSDGAQARSEKLSSTKAHRVADLQSDGAQAISEKLPTTEASTSKSSAATEASTSKSAATSEAASTTKAAKEEAAEDDENITAKATTTGEAATEAPNSHKATSEAPVTHQTSATKSTSSGSPTTSKAGKSEAPTKQPTTTPKPATAQSTSKTRAATTRAVSTTKAPAAEHAAQQCRCSQDTDYTGHDLYALPANTPEECCQACAVHPHCTVGILFVGRCWLKNSSAVVPRAPGRIACSAGKAHYLAEAEAVRGASCAVYGCGGYNPAQKCQCNKKCKKYGNCCFDNVKECLTPIEASCNRFGCNAPYAADRSCQCNHKCHFYGNCCPDYRSACSKAGKTLVFKKFELPAGPETLVAESEPGRLLAVVAHVGQGKLLVLASALFMALLAVAIRLRRPRRHGAPLTRHALARDEAIEGGLEVAGEDHGDALMAWWAE